MRIAIDARELVGKPTGVGRYLAGILAGWGELPGAAAHEFILCTPEPVPIPSSLRAVASLAPGHGTMWEQRVLPRLVAGAGADVLFAPGYTGPLSGRIPMVVTIHDVSFAAHPEWFSWREGLRRRLLTRWAARRASRVITVSDFSKREIVRHLGVPPSQVEVIYSGAPASTTTGSPRAPAVLYVGSLFNRRHVPELIEGFDRVTRRHPEATLAIVGDNRTSPRIDLDALIAGRTSAGRIHARSYVTDAELASLYASASAFAFLSDYEGFAFTPMEALTAGVPVVLLDTEVAREIYGPAAIYVERAAPDLIAAALERALFDRDERARVLAAAPAQLARYSWRECAQRTLQVLLAAAGQRRSLE